MANSIQHLFISARLRDCIAAHGIAMPFASGMKSYLAGGIILLDATIVTCPSGFGFAEGNAVPISRGSPPIS